MINDIVNWNGLNGRLVESYCDGVSKVFFKSFKEFKFVNTSELIRITPE